MIETTKKTSSGNKSRVVPLRPSKAESADAKRSTVQKRLAAPKDRDKLLSCRFELKYRIRESKAQAIARYVQSYIDIDRYSRGRKNLEYFISSLYMDSEKLDLCRETKDKKVNRFKLRIRCYDDEPKSPCFFEIKRRLNHVILKDRALVGKDMIARAVQEDYVPESMYKEHKKTLRQFQYYVRALSARPMILVRYKRQAFEGNSSNRVRITFDRKLSFQTVSDPILKVGGPNWQLVPMDFVVLEIKFTERYPAWLTEMVKIFDLKQTAMSKYVSTIQQSHSMGFCGATYNGGRTY